MNSTIPYRYTKFPMLSSIMILINAVVAQVYEYYLLSFCLLVLFFVSMFHWSGIYMTNSMKIADIVIAFNVFTYVTCISAQHFTPFWKHVFNFMIIIAFVVSFYNTLYFYEVAYNSDGHNNDGDDDDEANNHDNETFYKTYIVIHVLFLHLLPTLTCIFAIIGSSQ